MSNQSKKSRLRVEQRSSTFRYVRSPKKCTSYMHFLRKPLEDIYQNEKAHLEREQAPRFRRKRIQHNEMKRVSGMVVWWWEPPGNGWALLHPETPTWVKKSNEGLQERCLLGESEERKREGREGREGRKGRRKEGRICDVFELRWNGCSIWRSGGRVKVQFLDNNRKLDRSLQWVAKHLKLCQVQKETRITDWL